MKSIITLLLSSILLASLVGCQPDKGKPMIPEKQMADLLTEYYLMQAYILGGEADSFTPYELACVYDEMGDVTKTYIMMAIAEERGAAEIKEYREDPLYPWYLDRKSVV